MPNNIEFFMTEIRIKITKRSQLVIRANKQSSI